MQTEQLNKSIETMLTGIGSSVAEFAPEFEKAMQNFEACSQAFQQNKTNLKQEIESGARITKHRLPSHCYI